jgi:choloylglycine hydrolase
MEIAVKQKIIKKMVAASVSATLAFAPMVSNACTSFLLKGSDGGSVYGRTMDLVFPCNHN